MSEWNEAAENSSTRQGLFNQQRLFKKKRPNESSRAAANEISDGVLRRCQRKSGLILRVTPKTQPVVGNLVIILT